MLSRCIISLIKKIHIQTSEQLDPLTVWKRTIAFSSGRSSTPKAMDESNDQRISIGQMRATNDKDFNKRQVEEIVRRGVADQSCFIFLPECCDYVGTDRNETISLAESLSGETMEFYKKLARDNKVWLSLGGIHESVLDENRTKTSKIYNSHVILNSGGEIVEVYRKLHLFDVNTPEFKFRESSVVTGGQSVIAPLTETPLGGGLGLLICYDLRFPEVSTILRKNGATVLTYPSAFSYTTGLAHWEILLRARAIETQTYVIAAAQIGYHNEKRRSYGHAMVVDPWGKIITECGTNDTAIDCKTVAINLKEMNDIRSRMPCFEHRRNVYSLIPVNFVDRALTNEVIFRFEKHIIPKSTIFFESGMSVAFTNICCVVPGHVLVASRRRVERLKDLHNDEIVDFFLTVSKCQKILEHYYQTNSATVTVQDGQFAGQTVRHVHCHIMPRKEGDFEHNDQIYIELNKHDHTDGDASRKTRSIEEMSAEASQYRQIIEKLEGI